MVVGLRMHRRMKKPPLHVGYAVVLLLILATGFVPDPPVSGAPQVATQPSAPQRSAQPAAPAKPQNKSAAVPTPRAKTPAPKAARKVVPPAAKTTAAAPALDLDTLEDRLKDSKAIGFF